MKKKEKIKTEKETDLSRPIFVISFFLFITVLLRKDESGNEFPFYLVNLFNYL